MRLLYYINLLFWIPMVLSYWKRYKKTLKQANQGHKIVKFSKFWDLVAVQLFFIHIHKRKPVMLVLDESHDPNLRPITLWVFTLETKK